MVRVRSSLFLSISHTSSANCRAILTSWVDRKIIFPVALANDFSSLIISTLLGKSRKAVGSSRYITGVCRANALAIITFCRSPSLSVSIIRWAKAVIPTISNASSTIRLSSVPKVPQKPVYGERPRATISLAVMFCISGFAVSTTPMSRANSLSPYSEMSLLSMKMFPSSFGRNPDNVFSRVDLPTPLAPNKHVRLPSLSSPLSLEATILAFFDWASYPILRFLISMQFIGVE